MAVGGGRARGRGPVPGGDVVTGRGGGAAGECWCGTAVAPSAPRRDGCRRDGIVDVAGSWWPGFMTSRALRPALSPTAARARHAGAPWSGGPGRPELRATTSGCCRAEDQLAGWNGVPRTWTGLDSVGGYWTDRPGQRRERRLPRPHGRCGCCGRAENGRRRGELTAMCETLAAVCGRRGRHVQRLTYTGMYAA